MYGISDHVSCFFPCFGQFGNKQLPFLSYLVVWDAFLCFLSLYLVLFYVIPIPVFFFLFIPCKRHVILPDRSVGALDSSSIKGIFNGNHTLLISCICHSRYAVLALSLDIGSTISLSGTFGITGICDACVTGVDFAMGVAMLVIPGRVFS